MKKLNQFSELIRLLDVSGPFLAEPVLAKVFPQGLEQMDASKRKIVRLAYEEWREAVDLNDSELSQLHDAWINEVLKNILELDEDGKGDVLKSKTDLANALDYLVPEYGITLCPDYAVIDGQKSNDPLLLIQRFSSETQLDKAIMGDGWATTPLDRMIELCRANKVRLGLLTNGEEWTLVDSPIGSTMSIATWHARLWGQEPITLQAFYNLLGIRRFYVDKSEQLPALLDESLEHQEELTNTLGEQVERAVEVLIQALDRADVDRNRELLKGVKPTVLYEAALTVMMRIVFLLSAEERGLLLLGDESYEANYAVSTLGMQLRTESEEILERRWDAWSRLLAMFRIVYGGVYCETMSLPALGGSLFDPDRFPFLEGRTQNSNWKTDPAAPLPIDNRTVLLFLDAVQLFQGRTLSYIGLDVEQIGYIYEGLLEKTAIRASEITLDLSATKNAKKPWVTYDELETADKEGVKTVEKLLKDRTGSSASRIKNDLAKTVDAHAADKLLTACHGDQLLRDNIKPYFHILRIDPWGYPLVYPKDTFMVAAGIDRRETGTHYTPKSFTEAIVKETLEPVVYIGPAEGKPRSEWVLKTSKELLDLKICDPAMGSGAFLVQVCRWLSERVVEAWEQSEKQGKVVTFEGEVVDEINTHEPLRNDSEERALTARRLIAEYCLYGVDTNPLAVELAKLSIWLITFAKGRPFGFLDHNLRYGDSLLGIYTLDQLTELDMKPEDKSGSRHLFAQNIHKTIDEAIILRKSLRKTIIRDIRDIEKMTHLNNKIHLILESSETVADALVGEAIKAKGRMGISTVALTLLTREIEEYLEGDDEIKQQILERSATALATDLPTGKLLPDPLHWPLEFPEVFLGENGGFDAILGNPPFAGGQKITGILGTAYREFLVNLIASGERGSADLVAYFFLRAFQLLNANGTFGLIAVNTISEGDTRAVGLEQLLNLGATIYAAYPNEPWPGKAAIFISRVHIFKGDFQGCPLLNGIPVDKVSAFLSDREQWTPETLHSNTGKVFQGSIILGMGFTLDESEARRFLDEDEDNREVLFPYLGGQDVNRDPAHAPGCWVINFWDWSQDTAKQYQGLFDKVEAEVKPERDQLKASNNIARKRKDNWWLHGSNAKGLYHSIGRGHLFASHPNDWNPKTTPLLRVMVFARAATKYPCFTFVLNEHIYSTVVCVIAEARYSLFAVLSSDVHGIWAWEYGGRLEERLRYTHGDIFETFPFPAGFIEGGKDEKLNALGKQFFESRQTYMIANNKGMTKFYNDYHDPEKSNDELTEMRTLQCSINELILQRYDWSDIKLEPDFHQVGYLPKGNVRYTISENARYDLLHRLLMLNKNRHEKESEK